MGKASPSKLRSEKIEGVFIKELPNRFRCRIKIQEKVKDCYLPLSSKLGTLINTEGTRALLLKETGKKRYRILSVYGKENYSIVDMNLAESLVENFLKRTALAHEVEKEIPVTEKYRADLSYKKGKKKIFVEVKGVLSDEQEVSYPQIDQPRAFGQLKEIRKLLKAGKSWEYCFVLLSRKTHRITIKTGAYQKLFKECLALGMQCSILKASGRKNFRLKRQPSSSLHFAND